MTIWILAILLLASLAGLGYRQGAIRVAFSFSGILFGALLAAPLGHAVKPILSAVGIKSPLLLGLLPPCIVFLIVLTLFKIVGLVVHKKAEVFYKYHAGDLRIALWERLNHRVGLCLGLLNGAAYFILASMAIYALSYWTYQMATPDADPKVVRIVNRLGKDLQNSGMSKVAHAVDRTPAVYYDAADIVGLIYHTPLLEARLSRYPAFLGLAERPEFLDIASDNQFAELRQRQAPIAEMINYPKTQAILKNPDLLQAIKSALIPNLPDLRAFLETGQSAKYGSEKLIGRWDFDVNGAIGLLRKAKPNIPSLQMAQMKKYMTASFARTTFIATPGQQAFLKNVPRLKGAASAELQTSQGDWKGADGKYELNFNLDGQAEQMTAEITGSRLTITGQGLMGMAFIRED